MVLSEVISWLGLVRFVFWFCFWFLMELSEVFGCFGLAGLLFFFFCLMLCQPLRVNSKSILVEVQQ